MKHWHTLSVIACLLALCTFPSRSETLRRPITPEQPAWIIHIDVWNYADPQKIIDMVPEDVRPYVIFNIATSSSDEKSPDGPAIYDSWMKVCAQNRVWTMIQCASGAVNRMPDTPSDVSAYEQYFKDYPNFLGFNFAEQFWGFGSEGYVTFPERLALFAKLLPLCRTYGGYLAASFTDSYYNASKMPMAWLKRNSDIRAFLSQTPEHFLVFEKFTQKKNFFDIESNCLGQWLGGYAGAYGIRFDSSGWITSADRPDSEDNTKYTQGTTDFIRAAGAIPVAEHMMLTGQTIMDGPELIWKECSQETSTTNSDGYTQRQWAWYPQFEAISLDLFRKIIDGTIHIMSRDEVISRTKVCVVNDLAVSSVADENERTPYITPEKLYDGLYRPQCDQGGRDTENHWIENRWWMKSTGRYPAIPQTYTAVSGLTAFNVSAFDKSSFDSWMEENFPAEYEGDIYAGRNENTWVTYNPYQYDDVTDANGVRTLGKATKRAEGTIPLKYNTCQSLQLDYSPYSLGIIKEESNRINVYLSNYEGGTDVLRITGATERPTYVKTQRGKGTCTVTEEWTDGIYTLTVAHSGAAVEMTLSCGGDGTALTLPSQSSSLTPPALPEAYTGVLQYEAELADYKSATIEKSGYGKGRDGYYGQGFACLTSGAGALRYHINVPEAGYYVLTLRCMSDGAGSVSLTDLTGERTIETKQTNAWTESCIPVKLAAGEQTLDIANTGGYATYVDCIKLEKKNIMPFRYSTVNGECHVDLSYLTADGNVAYDSATGEVSVPAKKAGTLTLLLDNADFTTLKSLTLKKTGGDAFNYLTITDANGQKVNDGNFWSSKYSLNYSDYRAREASKSVYMIQWVANTSNTTDQSMVIEDIIITADMGSDAGVIDETQGTPVVIPSSVGTTDITYTRVLNSPTGDDAEMTIDGSGAMLYTVCLPYKPTQGGGLRYYTLAHVENGETLVFCETEEVNAFTPYLVASTQEDTNVGSGMAATVDFDAVVTDGAAVNGYCLRGTLRGLTNAEARGYYVLQSGNVWQAVPDGTPEVYIPPFRAFIAPVAGQAHGIQGASMQTAIEHGATGIKNIKTVDADGRTQWYDMTGRPLGNAPQQGIGIINGRKIVVR